MAQPQVDESDLEWIQLRKNLENDHVETIMEKFNRKFKQNPLIPIGEKMRGTLHTLTRFDCR